MKWNGLCSYASLALECLEDWVGVGFIASDFRFCSVGVRYSFLPAVCTFRDFIFAAGFGAYGDIGASGGKLDILLGHQLENDSVEFQALAQRALLLNWLQYCIWGQSTRFSSTLMWSTKDITSQNGVE